MLGSIPCQITCEPTPKLVRRCKSDGSTLPCINQLPHCSPGRLDLQKSQRTNTKIGRYEDTFATLRTSTTRINQKKEHHIRLNQSSRSSPTNSISEEIQEASPKGCGSGMPQKTPSLPISRHFIIADPIAIAPEKNTDKTPRSGQTHGAIHSTRRASPRQPVAHYSISMLSASASAVPSAINLRKSSLAFSTAS
jgi:hypothetical protein